MARPKREKVPTLTTQMDPGEVYAGSLTVNGVRQARSNDDTPGPDRDDTCSSCKFWFSFSDTNVPDVGECRGVPPAMPTATVSRLGRVCRYPVTLGPTPKCPLYQAR